MAHGVRARHSDCAGKPLMIPIRRLFETHLTVRDLPRSMAFYGGVLKLELALFFEPRRVAFYWMGGPGQSMLGLWEVGTAVFAGKNVPV